MTKYLLDTNILIHFSNGKYNVYDKLKQVGFDNCFVSEITLAEMKIGDEISLSKNIKPKVSAEVLCDFFTILPITNVIDMFAKEKARLRKNGTPMHDNFDLLIACTSVVNGLVMVTENRKDFQNVSGIVIENWIDRGND